MWKLDRGSSRSRCAWSVDGYLWNSPVAGCFDAADSVPCPVVSPKMAQELQCRRTVSSVTAGCLLKSADVSHLR